MTCLRLLPSHFIIRRILNAHDGCELTPTVALYCEFCYCKLKETIIFEYHGSAPKALTENRKLCRAKQTRQR